MIASLVICSVLYIAVAAVMTGLLRGVIHVGGELPFAQKLFAILPMPDDWKEAR